MCIRDSAGAEAAVAVSVGAAGAPAPMGVSGADADHVADACGAPPSSDKPGTWLHTGGVWGGATDATSACGARRADVDRATALRAAARGEARGGRGEGEAFAAIAEAGIDSFRAGDMSRADACWRAALALGGPAEQRRAVLDNLAVLEDVLARSTSARLYHALRDAPRPAAPTVGALRAHARSDEAIAAAADGSLGAAADPLVRLYRTAISAELCAHIVELFEAHALEQYAGNVLGARLGLARIDPLAKRTTEVDMSRSAAPHWAGPEHLLLRALSAAVSKYERAHPGFARLPNPLYDEGFRVKRYSAPAPDGSAAGAHDWHSDRAGPNCRELAALIFLNTLGDGDGGETLFVSPPDGLAVRPEAGALLLFPAGPTHFHAGGAITGATAKYVVTNFVTSCDPTERSGRIPPLSARAVGELREAFGGSPAEWTRTGARRASDGAPVPPSSKH